MKISESENEKYGSFHRVIIDTDTGGDDALALALAVKAPNIEILGVTVVAGNVELDQALKNAISVLETAGDGSIPVYAGATTSFLGVTRECFSVFGIDGMGDADLIHPKHTAQEQGAVDYILETVAANPGEIELVCLGPVTNVAMAMKKNPEIMKQVKRIWSMGTSGFGEGNATPVAEFNVYKDAEAYEILLESKVPLTVIGLNVCEQDNVCMTPEQMDLLSQRSELAAYLVKSWRKLLEFKREKVGRNMVDLCDGVAMYSMIFSDAIKKSRNCHAVCITHEGAAYGQVIFYKEGMGYDSMPQIDSYPVEVLEELNDNIYFERVCELLA